VQSDEKGRNWFFRATWTTLILVVSLAVGDAVLAPTPVSTQPDFIDTVLASRAAVAAIRIAIVFAALFVALSVIALTAQRRWLTRVGPVEVSAELSGLRVEIQPLEEELEAVREDMDAYTQQVVDKGQGV
jgi:hypothetical protein